MKKRKGLLYIRRLKPTDKASNFRTAIRMEVFKNGVGVFQHGFDECLEASKRKIDLKRSFLFGWKSAKKHVKEKTMSIRRKKINVTTNHEKISFIP